MNFLTAMLLNNYYDNICCEHLEYYSLTSLKHLLGRHSLEAYRVERNDVNGGSLRIYIGFKGKHPVQFSVYEMLQEEKSLQLYDIRPYRLFKKRIDSLKSRLKQIILARVSTGKTVYVYGASTRGNTILQYCGLDHNIIKKAADANPEKHGRVTVGTKIPIVSKDDARKDHPDYFLVLPYHFISEIVQEEEQYLANGGKIILPLPEPMILGH